MNKHKTRLKLPFTRKKPSAWFQIETFIVDNNWTTITTSNNDNKSIDMNKFNHQNYPTRLCNWWFYFVSFNLYLLLHIVLQYNSISNQGDQILHCISLKVEPDFFIMVANVHLYNATFQPHQICHSFISMKNLCCTLKLCMRTFKLFGC